MLALHIFAFVGQLGSEGITEVTFQMQGLRGYAQDYDGVILGVATAHDELDEHGHVVWQIIGEKNDMNIFIDNARATQHKYVLWLVVGGSFALLKSSALLH